MKTTVLDYLDAHQREVRLAATVISGVLTDPSLPEEKRAAGRAALTALYEGAANVKNLIDAAPDALPSGAQAKLIAKEALKRGAVSLLSRLIGVR